MQRAMIRMEPSFSSEGCASGKRLSTILWRKDLLMLSRPSFQAVLLEQHYYTAMTLVHGFPEQFQLNAFLMLFFFLDKKDIYGEKFIRSIYNRVVHLQNVSKVLPRDCLAKQEPTDVHWCFFPSEVIKSINTPNFILNSGYDSWQINNILVPDESSPATSWLSCKADIRKCDSRQIKELHGLRKTLIDDLKVVKGKEDWGFFIDLCFTHCQTPFGISWDSPISPRLENKTISEAFGDWHFGRSQEVKQIDCEYPCNPTCSTLLPS